MTAVFRLDRPIKGGIKFKHSTAHNNKLTLGTSANLCHTRYNYTLLHNTHAFTLWLCFTHQEENLMTKQATDKSRGQWSDRSEREKWQTKRFTWNRNNNSKDIGREVQLMKEVDYKEQNLNIWSVRRKYMWRGVWEENTRGEECAMTHKVSERKKVRRRIEKSHLLHYHVKFVREVPYGV